MEQVSGGWPELPYAEWRDTLETVHLYSQVVGKVQLALAPMMPQWAQTPLQVTTRGLTTRAIWAGKAALAIAFDLLSHQVELTMSDGRSARIPLRPCALSQFYREMLAALAALGVEVRINPMTVEVPNPVSCETDTTHSSYDRAAVERFFQALVRVDAVLEKFRAGYWAKQTPVSFWWGTFDLTVTRFSGRYVSPPAGRSYIERVAADAEQASVGFWPGSEHVGEAAFFAYTYPKPQGLDKEHVSPEGAHWDDELGEFLLPYDVVRRSPDPGRALLDFCSSTYAAGASLAGWDRERLERRPPLRAAA